MKDHLPEWQQRQRERERALACRKMSGEQMDDRKLKPSWTRRMVVGAALGSMGYLITSCFFDTRLHESKFDRRDFRFIHRPAAPQ